MLLLVCLVVLVFICPVSVVDWEVMKSMQVPSPVVGTVV